MIRKFILTAFMMLVLVGSAFGAHPLITDDTGTQGMGKFQLELNSEFSSDKETVNGVTTKQTGGEVAAILSYGLTETADIVLGMPYQWMKVREEGEVTSEEDGISDISLEFKWRFYEKDGLSLALKPGLTFPAGDEEKGLGNGNVSYSFMFITTKEIEQWAFHFNVGYMHNEFRIQEDEDSNRKNLWHASLASAVQVAEDLQFVTNIGVEKNPDKESNTHPAFILGGVIYSATENFDIDLGVKGGFNNPETDLTVLAGTALRF